MKSEFKGAENPQAEAIEVLGEIRDALNAFLEKKTQPSVVNVAAPVVKVDAPVRVEQPVKTGWTFKVTERDVQGLIKSFTATPK